MAECREGRRMHTRLRRAVILLCAAASLAAAGFLLGPRLLTGRRPARRIEVRTVYTVCGHRRENGRASPSVLGLLAGRAAGARYGDWRVDYKDDRLLRLTYERNELCPACRRLRFLGVSEGFVAVFRGTPGRRGEMVEVTQIPVSRLPRAELLDLRRGIAIRDERERLEILEGLASLASE